MDKIEVLEWAVKGIQNELAQTPIKEHEELRKKLVVLITLIFDEKLERDKI